MVQTVGAKLPTIVVLCRTIRSLLLPSPFRSSPMKISIKKDQQFMILRRSAPIRLQRMASFIRPLQELLPRIVKLIRGGFKIQPIRIL